MALWVYHCSMSDYTQINSRMMDRRVKRGWEWSIPVTHEECEEARNGRARIYLTPTKPIPEPWLGDLDGKDVLALASGGGQQGPILSAMGARTSVFDISEGMLGQDKMVAEREGLSIRTIQGDMTKPLPFDDGSFDIIVNPVSNCYIEHPEPVWRECFRILRDGGRLLAGMANAMSFIVDGKEERIAYPLPCNPLRYPEQMAAFGEDDGIQFSHSYEENIQGMIDSGFAIRGIYSDTNRSGRLKEMGIPSFYAILAEK